MRSSVSYIFLLILTTFAGGGLYFYSHSTSQKTNLNPLLAQLNPLNHPTPATTKQNRILHFWASWCGPCREELPGLLKTLPQLHEKYDIYLISEDDNLAQAQEFINLLHPNHQFLNYFFWDEKKTLSHQFQVSLMPETFIYVQEGFLKRKISGSMNWQDAKNLSFLTSLPSE